MNESFTRANGRSWEESKPIILFIEGKLGYCSLGVSRELLRLRPELEGSLWKKHFAVCELLLGCSTLDLSHRWPVWGIRHTGETRNSAWALLVSLFPSFPFLVIDKRSSGSSLLGPSSSVLAFSSPARHPVDAAVQTNSKIIKAKSMNEKLLYDMPSKCLFRSSKDVERRQGNSKTMGESNELSKGSLGFSLYIFCDACDVKTKVISALKGSVCVYIWCREGENSPCWWKALPWHSQSHAGICISC